MCEKDLDVCQSDPEPLCKNNAKCIEGVGASFVCECLSGFTGVNCQIDINECEVNPCLNNGVCEQTLPGLYKCQCTPKFSGRNCEIGESNF